MSAFTGSIRNGFLGRAFATISAANAVASAVEAHRAPRARDLRTLGIEPETFNKVRY